MGVAPHDKALTLILTLAPTLTLINELPALVLARAVCSWLGIGLPLTLTLTL